MQPSYKGYIIVEYVEKLGVINIKNTVFHTFTP